MWEATITKFLIEKGEVFIYSATIEQFRPNDNRVEILHLDIAFYEAFHLIYDLFDGTFAVDFMKKIFSTVERLNTR